MSADKQSDKEIYLTELTPASTKRRRTEEITLSQLQIEDYQPISNRIDSQSIRKFIHKKIFLRCYTIVGYGI